MELRDLNVLAKQLQTQFKEGFLADDIELPEYFKNNVKGYGEYTFSYKKYMVHLKSSSLDGYIPNSWFFIASYFVDYYNELQNYKDLLVKTLKECGLSNKSDRDEIMAKFPKLVDSKYKALDMGQQNQAGYLKCQNEASESVKSDLNRLFSSSSLSQINKDYLIQFVSDYRWWYGGKTIDRGDFYVSPVLTLANVVNASHSYIADLCKFLAVEKKVAAVLRHQNAILVESSLPAFFVGVFKYFYQNEDRLKRIFEHLVPGSSGSCRYAYDYNGLRQTNFFIKGDDDFRASRNGDFNEFPYSYLGENYYLSQELAKQRINSNEVSFYGLKPILESHYKEYTIIEESEVYILLYNGIKHLQNIPLQRIYYGAPGTGKSYKTNEIVKSYPDTIRTTFHPDSDYASFVGCYKPIEVEEKRTFVYWNPKSNKPELMEVVNMTGDAESNKEKKITYKFTQQAFLKAYIQAWEKMRRAAFPMSIAGVCFSASGKNYTVKSVETDEIVLRFVREIQKKDVEKRWSKRLSSGNFEWPDNNASSDTPIDSICKWIFETLRYSETQLPEDWWVNVLSKLEEDVTINGKSDNTVYVLNKQGEKIFIANDMPCNKGTLQEYYNDESKDGYESYSKVAGILRGINPDDFETAWKGLKEKVDNTNQSTETDAFTPQYLVIEEINRGNCAQIFGDIFQLLDRNDQGFSTYPIVPDADITRELKEVFKNLDLSAVDNYINGIFSENYPSGIVNRIKSGELLVLPRNLFILATMNTSDQSLFPMDSAFKRRWEWEYVPIRYTEAEAKDVNDNFHTFKITIGNNTYKWVEFLAKVNEKILAVTDSEDKQMGEYFIKKDIDEKTFINKVMYYLWSEVCKDNYKTNLNLFFTDDGTEFSFNELFKDKATALLAGFMEKLQVKSEEENKKDDSTENFKANDDVSSTED